MSQLLVIFGATGQQGGSVLNFVLNDQDLCKQYKVRAVTRDPTRPVAQALIARGIEVVRGDADDVESLKPALHGAHTVFSTTSTIHDDKLKEREIAQGKAIADTAVAVGARYLIYSSAVHGVKMIGHPVDILDAKAEVEEYIRTLPIKSAFFVPGAFMQNFLTSMAPRPAGESGVYSISNVLAPNTGVPCIETVEDSGKYVGAILAEPDKYEGADFYAATKLYSYQEIAQCFSKATGKTVKYVQLPESVFRGFLPPNMSPLADMLMFFDNPGYYGPQTKERVEWTAKQARGKLTTFEEFLEKNPPHLD